MKGDTLRATIEEDGRDVWQVVVDGTPTEVVALRPGVDQYDLSLGEDAVHEVSLVKRTEPLVGTTRFLGFDVPGGGIFQAHRHLKTIEFIGDSVTTAFGNEGTGEKDHFRPETENAYQSYASIAGRMVQADIRMLAWSGKKLWPDNSMLDLYDRVLPSVPEPLADAAEVAPAAVVINLATNDFAPTNPDEKGWSAAYQAFLRQLRARYPYAHLYATMGGMMRDDYPVGTHALSTARGYLSRVVARMHDKRIHFLEFEKQRPEDGLGSESHPNLLTHARMAQQLVGAFERDLGWKASDAGEIRIPFGVIPAVPTTLQYPVSSPPPEPVLEKPAAPVKPPPPVKKKAVVGRKKVRRVRPAAHVKKRVRRPVRRVKRAATSRRVVMRTVHHRRPSR